MNITTNSSSSSPWTSYGISVNAASFWIFWTSLVCAAGQVGWLSFIMYQEGAFRTSQSSRKQAWISPINAQLIALISCLLLCNGLYFPNANNDPDFQLAGSFFTALQQTLTLCYACYRGKTVINHVFPKSLKVLYAAVIVYGLLQVASYVFQVIYNLTPVSEYDLESLSILAVANIDFAIEIVAFCLESWLLVIYGLHLRRVQADEMALDTVRLAIIARYGVASFCCFQLTLVASIVFSYFNIPDIPIVSIETYIAFLCIVQCLPIFYIFIQLGMKRSLHNQRLAESVRKQDNVKRAKLIAYGHSSASQSTQTQVEIVKSALQPNQSL